jgi:hypothetical protein
MNQTFQTRDFDRCSNLTSPAVGQNVMKLLAGDCQRFVKTLSFRNRGGEDSGIFCRITFDWAGLAA